MSTSTSSQPQEVIVPPIADIEASTPGTITKDTMEFSISELFCFIEEVVDFESLRVNGMGKIKELLVSQNLSVFFDILNGPVYPNLVKDFWMKADVLNKSSFQRVAESGKTTEYLGQEIRSEVGGVCIRIRAEHIRQALKLPSKGLYLRSDEKEINTFMQEKIYGKGSKSKSNQDMKPLYKVLYKILHESIIPKVGFTDQVSQYYKAILYYIGLKAPIDFSKVFINHMCHSIKESKTKGVRNAHHSRLLSYMFYSSYLLHSLKPIFPDPKFLRVFHFFTMKAKLIVFPIRGRNWCFSRSIDHTLSASSSTTSSQSPSSLKQLWKTINTGDKPINAKAELLTDYVANKVSFLSFLVNFL
jgi:hypothetical protein